MVDRWLRGKTKRPQPRYLRALERVTGLPHSQPQFERSATGVTVVKGPRLGARGGTRMPSADGVLVAAIGLVLTGAGLPEAVNHQDGDGTGTGFLAVPVAGAAAPRAAVTWYEDAEPTWGVDAPAGKLRECEEALRRAGFHVEYTTEATGGCLLAWRRRRTG